MLLGNRLKNEIIESHFGGSDVIGQFSEPKEAGTTK